MRFFNRFNDDCGDLHANKLQYLIIIHIHLKGKDIYSNTDLVYIRRPQDENNHTISFFPIAHE